MNRFVNRWVENIKPTTIIYAKYVILAILLSYSSASLALKCKIVVPIRNDSFPLKGNNITVGNELPLGTIIYQQDIRSFKDYAKAPYGSCDGGGPYTDRQYMYFTKMPRPLSKWQGGTYRGKIFDTNIPGIGVVIARGNTGVNATHWQWYTDTRASIAHVQVWTTTRLILIKTGNISPGVLQGSSLPTTTYRNDYTVANSSKVLFTWRPYTYGFSGSLNVISKTCNVPNFTVDLGSWKVTDISKNGQSEWRNASIKMTNCPRFYGYINQAFDTNHLTGKTSTINFKGNAIGLKLSALYGNIDAGKGIIKLESSKSSATGIGIQIASGNTGTNTPLNLGGEKRINVINNTNTSISIPLVARYIKTEYRVTSGTANSKVTFTINYY